MKRDEILALLQEIPWNPCEESEGRPRYRAVEAFHCTFCAYTVCGRCYRSIPSSLLSLAPATTGSGAGPVAHVVRSDGDGTPTQTFGANSLTDSSPGSTDNVIKPRCFLCRSGVLERETVPVFEWTCEGPRPSKRLNRGQGASYDMDVVQRYYTMKEQREKRAQSMAPLTARFLGTDPSPVEFGGGFAESAEPNLSGALGRQPFCEEGCSFSCSVQNPRMEQSLVWCGVNRQLRESHPSVTGDNTITPLHTVRCPPTLPGLPPHRLRVHIPYGAYGVHKIHAVALYHIEDIYRRVAVGTNTLQPTTKSVERQQVGQGQPRKDGQSAAGKEHTHSLVRPLLVVEVLHRIATCDPLRGLLPSSWLTAPPLYVPRTPLTFRREVSELGKTGSTDPDGVKGVESDLRQGDDRTECDSRASAMEENEAHLTWPDGLRCEELLLAVDYLLQGRSVAVYGIASKYFFLHHIAQSAELRNFGVACVDGYRSSAGRIARQLREINDQLQQQRRNAEKDALCDLILRGRQCYPFLRVSRSEAPFRDETGNMSRQCYTVDTSTSSDSPRSNSYRSPVRDTPCLQAGSSAVKSKNDTLLRAKDTSDGLVGPNIAQLSTPQRKGENTVLPSPAPVPGTRKRERSIMLVHGDQEVETKGHTRMGGQAPKRQKRDKVGEVRGANTCHTTHSDAADAIRKLHLWLGRYCLSEASGWNYNLPLDEVSYSEHQSGSPKADVTPLPPFQCESVSLQPRYVVPSSDVMRQLRIKCRAPLRSCVQWKLLPSFTTQRIMKGSALQCASAPLHYAGSGPKLILIVHGIDELDPSILAELQNIAHDHRHRVVLLCSFDNPSWAASSGATLLEPFRLAFVHLRSMLLPRVHEMACVKSLALLTDFEAAAAGAKRFGHYGSRGGLGTGASLPLQDTIRRVIFSLPTTFAEVLQCMIERQEASGENVFVPMGLHQQHFDDRGMMISMGRLRAIERELTSNRLAIFDAAENRIMIPQHKKVLRVLEEIIEQRRNTQLGSGAPVEA